jgi:hypothetical protein
MNGNEQDLEIAGRDGDSETVGGILAVAVLVMLGLYWFAPGYKDSTAAANADLRTGRSVAHGPSSGDATIPSAR